MGRWVGQKMARKIGYPLWMAPMEMLNDWQKLDERKEIKFFKFTMKVAEIIEAIKV